jgi:uncharacterized membrane protein YoaK (UPF0700 family)
MCTPHLVPQDRRMTARDHTRAVLDLVRSPEPISGHLRDGSPIDRRSTVAALLALTVVTGLIDAVSYLGLGHVFVANMTGNVAFLGFSTLPGSGLSAGSALTALAGFLAGAVLGGRLGSHFEARPRIWLSTAFGLQALLLAGCATSAGTGLLDYEGASRLPLIFGLAIAFGIQNASVRSLGVPDLMTTILTMTLTALGADSRIAGGAGPRPHRRVGSVAAMLCGAAAGAFLLRFAVAPVLAVASALVGIIAAVFWFAPDSE